MIGVALMFNILKIFPINFTDTFLNYDEYGQRHSPVLFNFLSLLLNLGLEFDQIRFLHMHLSIALII